MATLSSSFHYFALQFIWIIAWWCESLLLIIKSRRLRNINVFSLRLRLLRRWTTWPELSGCWSCRRLKMLGWVGASNTRLTVHCTPSSMSQDRAHGCRNDFCGQVKAFFSIFYSLWQIWVCSCFTHSWKLPRSILTFMLSQWNWQNPTSTVLSQ